MSWNFTLFNKHIECTRDRSTGKLIIRIDNGSDFAASFLKIEFVINNSEKLRIHEISIISNHEEMDDTSKKYYFMGYCGFKDLKELKNFFEILSGILDAKTEQLSCLNSSRCLEFAKSFREWYDTHIKPCLSEEIELNKKYFNI